MAPSLRKRIQVNYPKCGDCISVRWKSGTEEVWWKANVLTVEPCNENEVLANGCIIYSKLKGFDEQMAEVQFMYNSSSGTFLRDITSTFASSSYHACSRSVYSGANPTDEWMHLKKKSKLNTCSWIYTRDIPRKSEDTIINASKVKLEPSEMLISNADELIKEPTQNHTQTRGARKQFDFSPSLNHVTQHDITSLQVVNDSSVIDKNKVLYMNDANNSGYFSSPISGTQGIENLLPTPNFVNVLTELRLALLIQFQSKMKPGKCLKSGDEYLIIKNYSTQVSCTLKDFISICENINSQKSQLCPSFTPSTPTRANVSLATDSLRVSFHRFRHFCAALGMRDCRDYAELICKSGTEHYKQYLRIIGTSHSDDNIKKNDSIYLGSNVVLTDKDVNSSQSNHIIRLSRPRTNWSSQEGRYLSCWHLQRQCIIDEHNELYSHAVQLQEEHNGGTRNNCNSGTTKLTSLREPWTQTFDVTWKRSPLPSSKIWTCDALRTSDVIFGQLHVSIPAIIVTGDTSCAQLLPLLANINYNEEFYCD